jgi:hypothetical protein
LHVFNRGKAASECESLTTRIGGRHGLVKVNVSQGEQHRPLLLKLASRKRGKVFVNKVAAGAFHFKKPSAFNKSVTIIHTTVETARRSFAANFSSGYRLLAKNS